MTAPSLIRVALFKLNKLLDYWVPETCLDVSLLKPGMRVEVPVSNQTRIGMIVAFPTETTLPHSKLKRAHQILDSHPLLPPSLIELVEWLCLYYHCSLGEAWEVALPVWLRKGKPLLKGSELSKMDPPKITVPSYELNPEQENAIHTIVSHLNQFQTFLLDGVTGSGKTEIYFKMIEEVLKNQKQVLLLVPEIGLTPQMVSRLEARFDCPLAVLHSKLTEKKRMIAWQQAASHEAPIVVGTRSSVFTPLKNPGAFIIDEEHDLSFKQLEGLRYSARDTLIMRGRLENCPVLLGSATPSLETLNNAHTARYKHLKLPKRAGVSQPPLVQVLDIRHKKLKSGLSTQLLAMIQEHIDKQGQALLFLNRRGFAPVLMCFDCGHVVHCKNCDAKLIIHFQDQKLKCHHCEVTVPLFKQCPGCEALNVHPIGFGTERVETLLHTQFGEEAVIRIDRDTTRKKGTLEVALKRVHDLEAKILLGTQMITKGHHLPHVTLVGILDIDSALFSTDFRSLERLGQLFTQVAGRAGRETKGGTVVLQTCHPEHPLLKILIEKGYTPFVEALLAERRNAKLPPFSFQALFRAEAKKSEEAFAFLHFLKRSLPKNLKVETFGPIAAMMERRQGRFRTEWLLQSEERSQLHTTLKKLVQLLETYPLIRKIKWSLDVDPLEMS